MPTVGGVAVRKGGVRAAAVGLDEKDVEHFSSLRKESQAEANSFRSASAEQKGIVCKYPRGRQQPARPPHQHFLDMKRPEAI